MGITELSTFLRQIGHDLRKIGDPLQGIVSFFWRKFDLWKSKKQNIISRSSAQSNYGTVYMGDHVAMSVINVSGHQKFSINEALV